jgi:hypothetical protein
LVGPDRLYGTSIPLAAGKRVPSFKWQNACHQRQQPIIKIVPAVLVALIAFASARLPDAMAALSAVSRDWEYVLRAVMTAPV